ncbi:hypothetical protein [Azospirillum argentinense]
MSFDRVGRRPAAHASVCRIVHARGAGGKGWAAAAAQA